MTRNQKMKSSKQIILFFLIGVLFFTLTPCPVFASKTAVVLADNTTTEEMATFEENTEQMATFNEEEEAAFDSEPVAGGQEAEAGDSALLHADHYHSAGFFSDRIKRSIQVIPWIYFLPFTLLAILAVITTPLTAKRKPKSVLVRRPGGLRKAACLGAGILLIGLASVQISSAMTYSSVKDAVTSFLGEGAKIYQTHIDLTAEAKEKLKKELQWEPDSNSIKVYYSKTGDGAVEAYAFVLSERLKLCGGLHKFCIKISADGKVEDVKVLELTCDRSYCINTKGFLKQFKTFDKDNANTQKFDVISGATLSTNLTHKIVQRSLLLFNILKESTDA